MSDIATSPRTYNWRDRLPVHPACEIIPAYTAEKLKELGGLIKEANRMNVPIITLFDPVTGKLTLLDGRSRLDSMIAVNIEFSIETSTDGNVVIVVTGYDIPPPQVLVADDSFDPYEFVAATNVGRRHLTIAEKRGVTAKLIAAGPKLSSRAIAELAGISHHTVEAVRWEVNAQNAHKERVEKTGRKARRRKPGQATKNHDIAAPAVINPVVGDHQADNVSGAAPPIKIAEPSPEAKIERKPTIVPTKSSPESENKGKPVFIGAEQIATRARAILRLLEHPTRPNVETAREKAAQIVRLADAIASVKRANTAHLDNGAFARAMGCPQMIPATSPDLPTSRVPTPH